MITPNNNITHPGIYTATIFLKDDNPNPLFSSYSFKIYVFPAAPPKPDKIIPVPIRIVKSNPAKTSKKLQVKIKSISATGLAIV